MKNNTVFVSIFEINKKFYWEYKNKKNNSIICRPNSKGHIPTTKKGAKNSFHDYAKRNNFQTIHFVEPVFQIIDGVPTIQQNLFK
jgi:hypothetical protein